MTATTPDQEHAMDPNKTIRTTAAGRRAAAARDGRLERGQEPTRPLMLASEAPAAAAHTPGPWMVHPYTVDMGERGTARDVGPSGISVAAVYGAPLSGSWSPIGAAERDANAAVLAAAPEMLASLQEAVRLFDQDDATAVLEYVNTAVRAAIAQARGRS